MAETQQGGELTGAEAQKTSAGDRTNERSGNDRNDRNNHNNNHNNKHNNSNENRHLSLMVAKMKRGRIP